ncbi:MAG TPA: FAD:protein FMN transferase [Solirubrobacteraceae bacterium]
MSAAPPISSSGRAGLHRVEHVMGMPVIIEVCDPGVRTGTVDRAYEWFRLVDRIFSTYRPESEISRLNRGELALADADPAVRSVLRRCASLRTQTAGYFDAEACSPGDGVDPSGLVKGWSVAGAARILERDGLRNFSINAGGDVLVRGQAPQGGPWRIGIQHPLVGDAVAAVVAVSDLGVATSGAYERGAHVIDPHRRAPPEHVLSVTVIGRSLPTADAYATAAFAMGAGAAAWCAGLEGYESMVITEDERVVTTAGFDRHRVR